MSNDQKATFGRKHDVERVATRYFGWRSHPVVGGAPWTVGLALLIATLAGGAVGIEGVLSFRRSFAEGQSLVAALFEFLRYFTILTNLAVGALMAVTIMRQGRPLPPAGLYVAVATYAAVTGVTYELLLRSQWSPHGLQFDTDLTLHDLVPALTLLFWVLFAPKRGLRWRDAAGLLVFPIIYFAATLVAGAFGADYPYDFLDVDRLGYPAVLATALIFLAVFYALGLLLIASGKMVGAQRSRGVAQELGDEDQSREAYPSYRPRAGTALGDRQIPR